MMNKGDILVVDDTPVNLKLISDMLTKNGYRVRSARGGKRALISALSNPPELVLLDIKMPDLDGYEVCARLKQNPDTQDIPIIFISALNDTEDIVKAFEAGGVDYVTKPFKFREVLVRVESQLTLARQRQQLELMRQQEAEYYETINQMRDRFIKAATHDLKNPIALIVGYTGLLKEHSAIESDDELMAYVTGIQNGTLRLRDLVTDLLDIAQMESGVQLNLVPGSSRLLIEASLSEYALIAEQRGLEICIEPGEDVFIIMDEKWLQRALGNLVSNAIKYTDPGGTIGIMAESQCDHIIIGVEDNGIGIPADDIPYLFDPFYRVREKRHKEIEGSGLGLTIVKSIVDQHNGSIQITSVPGKGSRFEITLPIITK